MDKMDGGNTYKSTARNSMCSIKGEINQNWLLIKDAELQITHVTD